MKKIVYIALEADIIHPGNINIIESANKYGDVIVGLLTDEAIGKHKRIPLLDYEQRKIIIQNIKNVKKVIPQTSFDYSENLQLIKPDYVVHGDDWKNGPQKKMRSKVIEILSEWGGELVNDECGVCDGDYSCIVVNDYMTGPWVLSSYSNDYCPEANIELFLRQTPDHINLLDAGDGELAGAGELTWIVENDDF